MHRRAGRGHGTDIFPAPTHGTHQQLVSRQGPRAIPGAVTFPARRYGSKGGSLPAPALGGVGTNALGSPVEVLGHDRPCGFDVACFDGLGKPAVLCNALPAHGRGNVRFLE